MIIDKVHALSLKCTDQYKLDKVLIIKLAIHIINRNIITHHLQIFNLEAFNFQNFPREACPQTPLEGSCFAFRSVQSTLLSCSEFHQQLIWPTNFVNHRPNFVLLGHMTSQFQIVISSTILLNKKSSL